MWQKFITWLNSIVMQSQTEPNTPPNALQAQNSPVPPQPAPLSPTIAQWAELVGKWEGSSDGNLKLTTLTKSWGAVASRPAGDGGFFCKWANEAQGVQALCNFLTLAKENQLIPYHSPEARTIKGFTEKYTGFPSPQYDYSDNLIKELGVEPTFDISNFLES